MTSARTRMISALRDASETHFRRLPSSIPVALPLDKFADAAIGALADGEQVPVIPAYDPEMAEARRWSSPSDDLTQGMPPCLGVERTDAGVEITVEVEEAGESVLLDTQAAVDFALSVLAAANYTP
jgi:hypothetical protein